jgi:D-amino peptidase
MKNTKTLKASVLTILALLICTLSATAADIEFGRQTFARSADNDATINIILYYDMEGLAGQNILTSIDYPRPEYFEARKLLTDDVNGVIDGLFAGGADSVTVVDAHGSFNPEPDILLDKMDPRARMLYKDHKFDPYADLPLEDHYDAVVAVGMHSKTSGGGFAEHTINLGNIWIFNGQSVNESEILAYSWGRKGIPLIMVTGDNKLAEQLSWMTWLRYVTVKEAKGIDDALLYPIDSVHSEMRKAAEQAVKNLDNAKAVRLTTPITATFGAKAPADLSILENVPGINYHDESVTFTASDFAEAYKGMRGLLAVAQSGYYDIAANMLFSETDGFKRFKEAVLDTWRASASTTLPPDENQPTNSPAEKKQQYFGSK